MPSVSFRGSTGVPLWSATSSSSFDDENQQFDYDANVIDLLMYRYNVSADGKKQIKNMFLDRIAKLVAEKDTIVADKDKLISEKDDKLDKLIAEKDERIAEKEDKVKIAQINGDKTEKLYRQIIAEKEKRILTLSGSSLVEAFSSSSHQP